MRLSAAMLACGWSRINDRLGPFQVACQAFGRAACAWRHGTGLEVLQRIEWPSVDADLKQQVRTCAESRTADLPDRLAVLHNLTNPDTDDREVRVPGRHSIAVIDNDKSPVTGLISSRGPPPGSGRGN